MQKHDIITEHKAFDLIGWLKDTQTFITVAVPHRSYERITVIIDTGNLNGTPAFQIDPPEGLMDMLSAVSQDEPPILHFEFSGEDQLIHRFEAPVAKSCAHDLWLHYPQHIRRYQLRRNYRIKAPASAELVIHTEAREIRLTVDNLSLGGALCHCPNLFKTLFASDMHFEGVNLLVTMEGECFMVTIDRAMVKRIEKDARAKHFGIAFEFLAIGNEFRKRLTKIIYDIQRNLLMNRLQDKN